MIRKFLETDKTYLEQNYFFALLEISYHGDVVKDEIYTYVSDENIDDVQGILFFKRNYTWYGDGEEVHKLEPLIYTEDETVEQELMLFAKDRLPEFQKQYPEKHVTLAKWVQETNLQDIQKLLNCGFIAYEPCPILKYSFQNGLLQQPIAPGFYIEELSTDEKAIDAYIEASCVGNDGTGDSKAELTFMMSGAPYFHVFMLKDGEQIVSAATTWHIEEGRSAIENIWTNPSYRKRGCAKTIIASTLNRIKEDGYEMATLSVRGRNGRALRLYQSVGFELMAIQIELLYMG